MKTWTRYLIDAHWYVYGPHRQAVRKVLLPYDSKIKEDDAEFEHTVRRNYGIKFAEQNTARI